jgi:tripartite-type tricarboxylate transporter receptor subunit TctC
VLAVRYFPVTHRISKLAPHQKETRLINRRNFIAAAVPVTGAFGAQLAWSQPAIDKPAKIIVGFPPGGVADTTARLIAEQLRGSYAPSVIVETKSGAGGRIAVQHMKTAEPDGSTMLLMPSSNVTIYPHVYKALAYAPADLAAVTSVASLSFVLSLSSAVPATVRTAADFVAWAKANPKDANYGTGLPGGTPHLLGVALARAAGVNLNHVPYKGGGPLASDLLGGQVQAGIHALPEALPHHQAGRLRIIALSGQERSAQLPNVPTFLEGGFKDVYGVETLGVMVPAGTPAPIVERLNAAVRAAMRTRPVIEGLEKLSFTVEGEAPAEFAKRLKDGHERWRPIVVASGFTAND